MPSPRTKMGASYVILRERRAGRCTPEECQTVAGVSSEAKTPGTRRRPFHTMRAKRAPRPGGMPEHWVGFAASHPSFAT
ncbi:MAG: hypothetical protein ABR524_11200 [Thermoanaerobaculia bacterium]